MIEFVDRKGSNCYKWDSEHAKGKLPLWVADMDFKAAQPIQQAIEKRAKHGVFGYNIIPDEYFAAVNRWFESRHHWSGISRENTIPTIGVVPALSAVLKAYNMFLENHLEDRFYPPKVVTFTPAYNCFFSSIRNLGAELVASPLVKKGNRFEIDWDDLEKKIHDANIFLLCNPHNPTGRVWTEDELLRINQLCKSNGIFIISDEIHCEITAPNHPYTPYATIANDNDCYCVLTSASKAFNIAGLQCANIYVPNKEWYERIDKAINIHEVCDLNPFGVAATIAAYQHCADWLDELNSYIRSNYRLLTNFVENDLPMLSVAQMEATYLAWVDISSLGISAESFCNRLSAEENVLFNPSEMYGAEGYIRINLATSENILTEALKRTKAFIMRLL